MTKHDDQDSNPGSASFKGEVQVVFNEDMPAILEKNLNKDLKFLKEANQTTKEKMLKKLFHKEVDLRMQIGRDWQRSGVVYKPPRLESIPVIQISASTLKDFDVKK